MKSDREVDLEFGIEQRDAIIRVLADECRFLRAVYRGWCHNGLTGERARRGVMPLTRRLTKSQQRVFYALTNGHGLTACHTAAGGSAT